MKKLVDSYMRIIPPGNYFIEDIEDIYEILTSVSTKVSIETDQYEFESLQELKEYSGQIKKIVLIAKDPYISVDIGEWVKIYTNKETLLARGAVDKIGTTAQERKKKFSTKSKNPSYLFTIILALLSSAVVVSLGLIKNVSLGIGLFIFDVILLLWTYYASMLRKSTIRLVHKHEAQNFLKANSDKIIIAIISAIAGGIVKIFIDTLGI